MNEDDHDCIDWNSGGACFICRRPLSIEEQTMDAPPSVEPRKVCYEAAPDRSGRRCDKPSCHAGDHWTFAGDTKTWSSSFPPSPTQEQP